MLGGNHESYTAVCPPRNLGYSHACADHWYRPLDFCENRICADCLSAESTGGIMQKISGKKNVRRRITVPGAVYRAGRNGGNRKHRRRSRRDLPGWSGGCLLDVDLRTSCHGNQVCRSNAVGSVPGWRTVRSDVYDYPGHESPVANTGSCVQLVGFAGFFRCRQCGPGQCGNCRDQWSPFLFGKGGNPAAESGLWADPVCGSRMHSSGRHRSDRGSGGNAGTFCFSVLYRLVYCGPDSEKRTDPFRLLFCFDWCVLSRSGDRRCAGFGACFPAGGLQPGSFHQ